MTFSARSAFAGGLPVLALASGQAFGADASVIQSLQDEFRAQTGTWFGPLENIATWLLLSLAVIAYAWAAIQMVLRNADLQEFVVELVKMVMFTGFFMALILNADTWSTKLIDGFMWTGAQVAGAGITGNINPAGIMERGFILAGAIIESAGTITLVAFAIIALVALVLYALIAAYALLVMAEMYIVTAAGVLLLGFGGSMWTADYAKRYITYCVSVGAKLYVLFLVVGLGEQFIYNWAIDPTLDKGQFTTAMAIVGVLVMLTILVKMIPDIIQGVINGTSIGSGTPTIGGMAAAGAGAAVGAVAGMAGAGMAVKEASKLAGEQLSGGAIPGSSTGASNSFMGVPVGGSGSGNTAGGSSGTGPLPMPGSPSAGQHAMQTVKNLGRAAMQTMGGRIMGDYNASHGSFGGSMAQNLRAERLTGSGQPQTAGHPGESNSGQAASKSGMSGSFAAAAKEAASSVAGGGESAEQAQQQTDFGADSMGAGSSSTATTSETSGGSQQKERQKSSAATDDGEGSAYHSPAGRD